MPIRKFREFEGLRVREGRGDILVQPTVMDIKYAVRHDPENCAYARCLRRMLETTRVFVYTTVCYVQTLDERGNPIMERYMVKNHAHAYIKAFDEGQPVQPGGFILHKPTGSATLEYKRRTALEYAHRNPAKVKTYYERARAKVKAGRVFTGTFRDGQGLVHFRGEGLLNVRKDAQA